VSQAGYTSARRLNSAGIPASKGIVLGEMTTCGEKVAPPSSELEKAMVFAA